jgi:hypothetical protein
MPRLECVNSMEILVRMCREVKRCGICQKFETVGTI